MRLKLITRISLAVLLMVARGTAGEMADVPARYHCAGTAQLPGLGNFATFNKIFGVPSASAFEGLARERFSGLLAGNFQCASNVSAAALLEPLLNDVVKTESLGGFGGSTTNPLSFVLALHLDAKRAQFWQDNLAKAFGNPGEKYNAEDFDGWCWNRGAANSFWMVSADGWLVVGRGDELLPLQVEYLQEMKRTGRPAPVLKGNWLEADVDGARLAASLPAWTHLLKPARYKISVAGENDRLRVAARVIYPAAITWESHGWQVPTELMQSPQASFTTGQDVGAFLNLDQTISQVCSSFLTNQFYAWALNTMPFQTYLAWPVVNATNVLEKLATNTSPEFVADLKKFNGTEIRWQPQSKILLFPSERAMRVMVPALTAPQGTNGDFLLLSMFPRLPVGVPAPSDLLERFSGRTNLVYYDQEMTGPRLQAWRLLGNLILIPTRLLTDDMMDAKVIEDKWLSEASPLLGNAVTEISCSAPNELSIVRTSSMGFTAIEIFLFSDWLSTIAPPPINPRPAAN